MRVHLRTREPQRDYLLEVGENVSITPESDSGAEAELQIPAEAFLRPVYGRLDTEHTPTDITTQNVEWDDLRWIFSGF